MDATRGMIYDILNRFGEGTVMNDAINKDQDITSNNQNSWNSDSYTAWIERFGTPEEIAVKIKSNPIKMLSSLKDLFGDVKDKKILNIMGSNGIKGVALAVLGADVTIVDFSEENKKYALEVAESAKVKINYIQSDILKLKSHIDLSTFNIVFAEMGILHYFTNLGPFMSVVFDVLQENGIFILKDFHPISTKLISYRGSTAKVRKYKVSGDYFDESLEKVEVAFSKHLQVNDDIHYVYIRKWTLGEIITAIAESGLILCSLKEEPNQSSDIFDKGIPKTFTVVSRKEH
jgi:2-polyprenyl-3-methyl-5-hydroxy-6-metoxy-1,4-benzoquinol methylase